MREQLVGRWNEIKGRIKQRWGQLTDDDLAESQGRMDVLVGKIQQKYGGTREEIERQLGELLR